MYLDHLNFFRQASTLIIRKYQFFRKLIKRQRQILKKNLTDKKSLTFSYSSNSQFQNILTLLLQNIEFNHIQKAVHYKLLINAVNKFLSKPFLKIQLCVIISQIILRIYYTCKPHRGILFQCYRCLLAY